MTVAAAAPATLGRHLIDVEGLDRRQLDVIVSLAARMREARATRAHRSMLEDETVALAFYEPSTRTRISFELAARALGATVVDLGVAGSSVVKGESLVDTMRTLERTGAGTVVLRHPEAGAPHLVATTTGMHVVNAGDGAHAHPTQALADLLTLREALGSVEGRTVAIVGDVAHSRVARSNLHALVAAGVREVRLGGPEPWVRPFEGWPGTTLASSLTEALDGADAVMALRVQVERDAVDDLLSLDDYVREWRIDEAAMRHAAPGAPILHPGPTNEGVELTAELANGPRSLIGRQVENGVPVRMAVMALVCGAA